jgi:hypothetical protein
MNWQPAGEMPEKWTTTETLYRSDTHAERPIEDVAGRVRCGYAVRDCHRLQRQPPTQGPGTGCSKVKFNRIRPAKVTISRMS